MQDEPPLAFWRLLPETERRGGRSYWLRAILLVSLEAWPHFEREALGISSRANQLCVMPSFIP